MLNHEFRDNYLKDALSLAYLGDSVFSLMVRRYLVEQYDLKVNTLNKKANSVVCARAQAEFMTQLLPVLNPDEQDIAMRARNKHLTSKAKNSTVEEYNLATQFEAVVGYWYINGEREKLENMFTHIVKERL